jgi:flavin reductase (DIM6/NTAB) family NADH-FMN oxidoreductase RutF
MPKRSFPLSKVYGLLEPGPVVLLTTARKGAANVMTMSCKRSGNPSSKVGP